MIKFNDYVAGWLGSRISDFLQVFPSTSKTMKYALITCLDSNVRPSSLLEDCPELMAFRETAEPIGNALIVPTKEILRADFQSLLFYGFDEVWFFPTKEIEPKPESVWLVGPQRIDSGKMSAIGPWMKRNNCSLGLGDGEGVNFIVKARGLVAHLLGHSIDQIRIGDNCPTEIL